MAIPDDNIDYDDTAVNANGDAQNHRNGQQHNIAMEQLAVPITKVPALNITDPYVLSTEESILSTSPIDITHRLEPSEVLENLLEGYARFIAALTGLDDLAFAYAFSHDAAGVKAQCGVVRATREDAVSGLRKFALQKLSGKSGSEQIDETQFSVSLTDRDAIHEYGGHDVVAELERKPFSLRVQACGAAKSLKVHLAYSTRHIPKAAVSQIFATLRSFLIERLAPETQESCPDLGISPRQSVVNHPPLTRPPSLQNLLKVDSSSKPNALLHAEFERRAEEAPHFPALDFLHPSAAGDSGVYHSILTYAGLTLAASRLAKYLRGQLSGCSGATNGQHVIPVYMSTCPELYISYLGILKAGFAFSPIPQDAPPQRVKEILEDISSPVILGNTAEPADVAWSSGLENQEGTFQPQWVNVEEITGWKSLATIGQHDASDEFSNSHLTNGQNGVSEPEETEQHFEPKEDDVAYLLYTSGSTGKPKGVQIKHISAACSINSHATAIPLPYDSVSRFRWFQFASPTFDPSLMEIFVTLSSGATLCAADRELMMSDLESSITELRATIMMATPSLAALLRPSRLPTLKHLWTMGEKLNRTVIDNFAEPLVRDDAKKLEDQQSRMLVNAYGPTEGSINCTFLGPVEPFVRGSIIGEALPTCAMFVLDPNSQVPKPVAAGLCGELAIGGPQVSKGYLNRPEQTLKAFVQSEEFGYLYRTGDMARIVWNDQGRQFFEFLGRISTDQVKVNGRRMELGEIESVLATVDQITEIVALVHKRDPTREGSEQVVACVVPQNADQHTQSTVLKESQENFEKHLPSYMWPSGFVFLDNLPRSSSGKVDRKALVALIHDDPDLVVALCREIHPQQEFSNGEVESEWSTENVGYQEKSLRTHIIEAIAATTKLSPSSIKPPTSLYSLGIDSLGAMRFLQKIRDAGVTGLSVADVLRAGTVGSLAVAISRRRSGDEETTNGVSHGSQSNEEQLNERLMDFSRRNKQICAQRLNVEQHAIESVHPTTATQSGMLASFLRSSSATGAAKKSYIYHSILRVERNVDLDRLRNSFHRVIGRYDSFRTVFSWLDDDLAPFAQCVLSNHIDADHRWESYSCDDSALDSCLSDALCRTEDNISLESRPWGVSLFKTPSQAVVVLSMFHAIFDGGSLQLLLEDITLEYHRKPQLTRTPMTTIVKHHFTAEQESTQNFWSGQLSDFSPVPFPCLTGLRPELASGVVQKVEITATSSYSDLKDGSKELGSTPIAILQAAWASILLAYTESQSKDVVIGSVVSGRLDGDSELCIGPTFTTIPIRVCLSRLGPENGSGLTNALLAQKLTAINVESLSYLQPRLGSIVTPNGQLPYDTLLAFQDFGNGSVASDLWSSIEHPPMGNDFAIMIEVWPTANGSLTLRATFGDAFLDQSSARVMLQQLDSMLSYIISSPHENFNLEHSRTPENLLSICNPQPTALDVEPERKLIHSQFEEHANERPDDIALIFISDVENKDSDSNVEWTYGVLNGKANRLANILLEKYGPLTGTAVPLCIEKSPALYIAILGVLKAGGAWCPIDTFSPPQRRHDLVARTEAKMVLVGSYEKQDNEHIYPSGVDILDISPFVDDESQSNQPPPLSSPADMAYLIWTSGTTGAPKGVPIKHSAGHSAMKSLQETIPTDVHGGLVRCLQFSQYTFDVSIQDLFYTWGVGGVLISSTREIMLGSFSKLANLTKATHAHLTPAFSAGVSRNSCETLEVITMIGEKLTQPVADDWGSRMRAFNTYGPAEVTVVSTTRQFGDGSGGIKSSNIGWPLSTVSVFVVKNGTAVMKNAIGELVLGGPQLSEGYLKQQEKTAEKFVWNDSFGQMVYHTGDMVRMLHDGSLEYIDREDDLVKLGGIRVELSEISFSISGCHSSVEQVETSLMSRPDRPAKLLICFLSTPGLSIEASDENELVLLGDKAIEVASAAGKRAQSLLPDHMLPSVYIVLKSIPKTQSAKTDRKALLLAYESLDLESWELAMNPSDQKATACMEKGTYHEQKVYDTVSSLSGISPTAIKNTARLGALGVDSIRAIRLASRLKEAGLSLSVVDVLRCSTVQDLVTLAGTSVGADKKSDTFDVHAFDKEWHDAVAEKVEGNFTVSRSTPIQESLLSETMNSSQMYWSNHFYELDPSIDLERLCQAWVDVCANTESLRTGFIPTAEVERERTEGRQSSSILQVIYGDPVVDWQICACSPAEYDQTLRKRIDNVMENGQSNYFRSPPWAVTVFDQGARRVMVFTLHHSIHDGPSLEFINTDLKALYANPKNSSIRRNQLQLALSVVLPKDAKAEDEITAFWTRELEEYANPEGQAWPELTGKKKLPGESKRPHFITEERSMTLPAAKLQAAFADASSMSSAQIAKAAWGCTLQGYLGSPATVFGETLSDRVLDSSLEDTIAPLITVVPVPFRAAGTARELLSEQARLSSETWKNRSVPAQLVRKLLACPRGRPLYPAVFAFHPSGSPSEGGLGETLWTDLEDHIGLTVEHPMALNVSQTDADTIVLTVSADDSIISRQHLQLLARQVEAYVEAMVNFPDQPLTELVDHFSQDLLSRSTPVISEDVGACLTRKPTFWIEHHASLHPDWIAVEVASTIDEDGVEKRSMTYGELNAAANRVAGFITGAGVRDRMIGMCLSRSLESYPIVLGIFKSGNTYLPIDESLPNDRKAFLVEDADCAIAFTECDLADTFSGAPESCRIIRIDDPDFEKRLQEHDPADKDRSVDPGSNSYLLYTSGSTGKPKGVIVTHSNLSGFIEAKSEIIRSIAPGTLRLAGKGKYLALASRAFDVHLAEIFLAWRLGLASVTANRSMLLDDLGLALKRLGITHASFVPSLLDQANLEPEDFPNMVYLSVGGEKISQRVLNTWGASDKVAMINAYGPTEVAIGCSAAHVTPGINIRNIGPPLGGCIAHVLVPGTEHYALRGQTGELCFTGYLVARGYHKRPDAKGFVENFHGERMYRTGDIARLMVDDSIEYLGRGDDQTKIRGQRLELGEVSEVVRSSTSKEIDVVTLLAQHKGLTRVQLASFFAPSESRKQKQTGSPVFLETEFRSTARELQASCREKLPAYMVPEIILPVTFIPLAPMSGKADVKQLQALFSDISLSTLLQMNDTLDKSDNAGPRRELTADEKEIVEAITNVTRSDPSVVDHSTNIFEIGIDSLSAINLSVKLKGLGYNVNVATVMSHPVVEQLATVPRKSGIVDSKNTTVEQFRQDMLQLEQKFTDMESSIPKDSIASIWPCLPLQEGLVARSMNQEAGQLYVNHIVLKIDNADVSRLKQAWEETAKANNVLRTTFSPFDKEIVQVVLAVDAFQLPWTEETSGSLENFLETFESEKGKVAEEIVTHIQAIPPLRFRCIRSGSGDPVALAISLHHALYDGESFSMILEEVAARYQELPVPSRGSPEELIAFVRSQDLEESGRFWTNLLKDVQPAIFPGGGTDEMEKANIVHRHLGLKISTLEQRASSLQATAASLVQSVFALLLAEAFGRSDVTYGLVLSGRAVPISGAESILLPCITTVPQRLNAEGASVIADVVKHVQESNASILEYQHTALRHIQRWVGSDTPLFDCLFSFAKTANEQKHELWHEVDSYMPADYPLAVEVEADGEKDRVTLHCAFTSVFQAVQDADSFLEKMEVILNAIANGEAVALENFGLSSSSQVNRSSKKGLWSEDSWSPTETKLRELVAQYCDVSTADVSKNVSFFRLGIDSVTAIPFARTLRESNLPASSSDILRFSNIGSLSDHLQKRSTADKPSAMNREDTHEGKDLSKYKSHVPVLGDDDHITEVFECTPLQTGMLTQTLGLGNNVYVHHHTVRLQRSVDIARLRGAVSKVIQENKILRTSFHSVEALNFSWIGAVHANASVEWNLVEASAQHEDVLAEVRSRVQFAEASQFSSPPLKVWIITRGGQTYMSITMHHSIYDGASIPFIFQDISRAYNSMAIPQRPQFTDVVESILKGQQEAVKFWTEKLVGYKISEIPSLPESAGSSQMLFSERVVGMDNLSVLNGCKKLEVTVQTVALAAFAKVLACLTGCRDVVFGHVVAGRSLTYEGVEDVIGPMFNTLPLRVTLDPKFVNNKAIVGRLQHLSIDGQQHQHAPLRSIQNILRQSHGFDAASLFDSLFVFQKSSIGQDPSGAEKLWEPYDSDDAVAESEYRLNVEVEHTDNGLTVRASAKGQYLSQTMLDSLLDDYDATFRDIIQQPDRCATVFPESLQRLPLQPTPAHVQKSTGETDIPSSSFESTLQEILSDIAGVPTEIIKPNTSIYSIGLDSIAAIRIASACRAKGLKTGVADVLQGNTLRGIANRISATASSKISDVKPLIDDQDSVEERALSVLGRSRESVEAFLPCLAGQAYHLASWLKSGRTLFEPAWTYSCSSRLDANRLGQAWLKLRERHPILRTCFVATSPSQAVQVILRQADPEDGSFRSASATSGQIQDAAMAHAKFEATQPSSLQTPPVRLRHIIGDDQDALMFLINHAAYDAWSMPTLVSELMQLYADESSTELRSNPDFPAFVEFTTRSLRQLDEKKYWQSALKEGERTLLAPLASDRSKETGNETGIPEQLFVGASNMIPHVSDLESQCREEGLSLQTIVLLAIARAIATTASVHSPTFGLYQAGRSAAFDKIDGLSGPCLNVTPFTVRNALQARNEDKSAKHIAATARQIQSSLADRVSYEQSALRDILQWVTDDSTSTPLFNTWVNLLWHQAPSPPPSTNTTESEEWHRSPPLTPLAIGVPTDFSSKAAFPITPDSTSVSQLDTSYLPDANLFLDVGPDPTTDSIGFGVRVEGGLMDEGQVRGLIDLVCQEVKHVVENLQAKNKVSKSSCVVC